MRRDVVGPWFRRHPEAALAVAALLFSGVTVLRFVTGDERDATALLYALPVTLLAMTFGRAAGTAAAGVAVGLLVAWVVLSGTELTPIGWLARAAPLLLLGYLVGAAAAASEEAARTQTALDLAELRRRDAAEMNDGVAQRLAAARWRLESGAADDVDALLAEAADVIAELVVSLLEPDTDRLTVTPSRTGRGPVVEGAHGSPT